MNSDFLELGILLGRIEEKLERIEENMNSTWWYVKKWQEEKRSEEEKHENCGTPECCGKCDTAE
jgi:hypothetical protein